MFAAYGSLAKDLDSDVENVFAPILRTLAKLEDRSLEKSTLLVLMLHRLSSYERKSEMKGVAGSF